MSRWSASIVAAADSMERLNTQEGGPTKVSAKSVPWTSGAETGVTPSAWNTWAVTADGGTSQVPPEAVSGSRSVIVRFQASAPPALWTSSVKVAGVPIVIVAGPLFSSVSSGSTIVIGGEVPGAPGSWLVSSSSVQL